MAKTAEKTCLECGGKIIGRVDKKFCSDQCRVSYNNKLNGNSTNYIRNVNNALKKNRRILLTLNPTGKSRVGKDKLLKNGFNFHYHTSSYKTKDGAIYFFCYEQGYLEIENNFYLLVVKNKPYE
jgi:predicted nucleic acid-binding Zn ribbon protein